MTYVKLSQLKNSLYKKLIEEIKSGVVGVIPTDTIYGIVGSALNPEVIEKIYKLRQRDANKPMIILISTINQLKQFDIDFDEKILEKIWPNPVSIIFKVTNPKFKYLHRGTNSLAFRLPKSDWLNKLIDQTGPLVAPSANLAGRKPASNIDEAKNYFKDKVDFYIDSGEIISQPSTLVEIINRKIKVLRQGGYKLSNSNE